MWWPGRPRRVMVFHLYCRMRARDDAKKAQVAQLKERRVDFELTALRELLIAVEQVDALRVRALASTLPREVAPITRAAALLPSTEKADRIVDRLLPEPPFNKVWTIRSNLEEAELKDQVTTELVQAIDKRVRERAPTGSRIT